MNDNTPLNGPIYIYTATLQAANNVQKWVNNKLSLLLYCNIHYYTSRVHKLLWSSFIRLPLKHVSKCWLYVL